MIPPTRIMPIETTSHGKDEDPCDAGSVVGNGVSSAVGVAVGVTGVRATATGVGVGVTVEAVWVVVRYL